MAGLRFPRRPGRQGAPAEPRTPARPDQPARSGLPAWLVLPARLGLSALRRGGGAQPPAEPEGAAPGSGSPWRMLPIAANLLPGEIVDARRLRGTRRVVLAGLAAAIMVVTSWYGVAGYQTERARSELDRVNDDVQRQLVQQRAFADLIGAQTDSKVINSQLTALFASDLQWARLLSGLRAAAPDGVQILGLFGALATQQEQAAATDGQLPGVSTARAIGTMTITAAAPDQASAAAYVDALGSVAGVADPLLGDANLVDGAVQFTVRLTITADALGGRFSPTPGPSGPAAAGGDGTGGG